MLGSIRVEHDIHGKRKKMNLDLFTFLIMILIMKKMIIMKIIEKAVKSITCEFAVDCFVRRCKPLTPSHKSRVKGNIEVTA